MRAIQKLVRCGGATHFTVPRAAMFYLGWLPGESVIVELLEDKSIRVRRPTPDDFDSKPVPALKLASNLPLPK